ncbi:MAG: tetratricopeptide repeat protein [Phycisphaeraceae bacterium]|nr:tetratricopeptide repeat protein [Phycisphaeraceae bacterium]
MTDVVPGGIRRERLPLAKIIALIWNRRDISWLAPMLLVAMTVATYMPAALCGYIWDDDYYVTENKTLHDLQGLRRIWLEPGVVPQYYPLVHSTFWVEYRLWVLNPEGYHAVNVALHALGAVLAWRVLRRLGVPGAFLAAALFAVHPVHVESVAWITERKNVLSGVMYLLAALAYFRFSPPEVGEKPDGARWRWYAAAILLLAMALLSKTVTCTLPTALGLMLWWKRGRFPWRDVAWLAPMVAIGVAMGLHTAHMEQHVVGAVGEAWSFTPGQRVVLAGSLVWLYAWKLLWPAKLVFFYAFWPLEPGHWEQWLAPGGVALTVALLVFFRRRIGGGPAAGALYFIGTLFPALGFFNVYPMMYSYAADHFQYLASLGLIALAAGVAATLGRKLPAWGRPAGTLPAIAAVLALMARSWLQLPAYVNAEALWRHTLSHNPTSFAAMINLGNICTRSGRSSEAVYWHRQSIVAGRSIEGWADYNLGCALMAGRHDEESLPYFRAAIAKGRYVADSWGHLGQALARLGRHEEAEHALIQALTLGPENANYLFDLASVRQDLGKDAGAMVILEHLAKTAPDRADVWEHLGTLRQKRGDAQGAIACYGKALAINPAMAAVRGKLGLLLCQSGRMEEGLAQLAAAVKQNPGLAAAQANYGSALAATGQVDRAIEAWRKAVALDPTRRAAARSLAWALATSPTHGPSCQDEALRMAKLAGTDDLQSRDTLAAALANAGLFDEAARVATQAMDEARQAGLDEIVNTIARHAERYRAGRPWRVEEKQ